MTFSRRQLLQGIGAGAATGLLGTTASASASASSAPTSGSDTRRVIIHPREGLLGTVLDVVDSLGGTTLLEYDNFDFVAAEIPVDRLDDLLAATGVAAVEDDDETGIPDGWSPSLLDFLLPPDRSDCSTHPDQRASWGHERIGADEVEPDGTGVDIGILDTGIQSDHCSLSVAGGQNFTSSGTPTDYEDRHGHGTHVAGIAGAVDNDLGVIGTASNANLHAVKVLDDEGRGRYSELIAGIDWCMEHDVELISMSLGGESESDALAEAIESATEAGHLLLSAAGNEGNPGNGSCDAETMSYPATHEDVLAVAAMNEDETLASYSSVGSGIELLAPGTEITSTMADNEYAEASGTSMACPFVTGVAALVWEGRDEDGPGPNEAVRRTLTETAEPVLDTCEEGAGLVDARAAVDDHRPADDADEDGRTTARDGGGGLISGLRTALEWFVDVITGFVKWLRGLFG